jgi:preprotein translocase subunit SecE
MAETTKKTATGSEGKELPAPAPARQRGGPIQFYNETIREMKKVTWPTVKETWLTTVMVFIMVGLTVVFFFFVDTVLAFGERLLIGVG